LRACEYCFPQFQESTRRSPEPVGCPTGNGDELGIDQEAIYIRHPDYIRDDEGFMGDIAGQQSIA
jgi:hypothetical protein